jgi:hypothetical protein
VQFSLVLILIVFDAQAWNCEFGQQQEQKPDLSQAESLLIDAAASGR